MATVLVLHGPNLNLLGGREPQHYGHTSLAEINARLESQAQAAGHALVCFQSNAEHELVERIHAAQGSASVAGGRMPEATAAQGSGGSSASLRPPHVGILPGASAAGERSEELRVPEATVAQQETIAFIIINPAAFTHTSVALRDALSAVKIPFIEVHLSNVHAREAFRHHSYFSDLAVGVISGFGPQSYDLALQAALSRLPVN